jgi:hypothetical protein
MEWPNLQNFEGVAQVAQQIEKNAGPPKIPTKKWRF